MVNMINKIMSIKFVGEKYKMHRIEGWISKDKRLTGLNKT